MSKLIHIGEHEFEIPEPADKRDILFYDMKDPYWVRELAMADYNEHGGIFYDFMPGKGGTKLNQDKTWYDDNDGTLLTLNKEDSDWMIRMYEREWKRRTYGVHFKNGKEITWVTGDYWFILAHCKTKRPDKVSDFFDYYEYQSEYLQLVWYVNNSPWIEGLDLSKAKKTGITNIHWLYFLNKATMSKNLNLGNMNITQDKGAKTFKDHFIYAFNGLPMCLKPGIKTKSEADGIITFGERATNVKRNSRGKAGDDELNTTVMCVPTAINAFDVDVFSDTWYDEPPKFVKDFGEIYRSNSEATKLQDTSAGKKWLTSYTPEGDAPSFKEAKELFFDSELRTINPQLDSRQTKSGLICHHIPAYASWKSEINKYGKCNEKAAMGKIQARRDALKDKPRELNAETRRYANNKREAWTAGGAGSVFDNVRLSEILLNIEEELRESILPPYGEGKLEWLNKEWELGLKNRRPKGTFCPVEFVPLTLQERKRNDIARLRVYQDIPDAMKNAVLKNGFDEWGCLIPHEIFTSFLGADPTQHAAASEIIEGSKNAWWVENAVDPRLDQLYGKVASGICNFEYFYRPELPDEAYEDLVKLIIYTGSLCGVEANVPNVATKLLEEGLGRFMMVKDKYGMFKIWERWMGLPHEEEKEYHLLRTTSNSPETRFMLEYFVRLWIAYLQIPSAGEKDYGSSIKSERICNQLMNLDVTSTKTADLFMASGYCKFVRDQYSAILMSAKNTMGSAISITDMLKAFTRA